MQKFLSNSRINLVALLAVLAVLSTPASAQRLRIRDICRVKGQEENTLHGLGLVVGLEGTGDGDTKTTRALAKMMERMGNPVAIDAQRQPRTQRARECQERGHGVCHGHRSARGSTARRFA